MGNLDVFCYTVSEHIFFSPLFSSKYKFYGILISKQVPILLYTYALATRDFWGSPWILEVGVGTGHVHGCEGGDHRVC